MRHRAVKVRQIESGEEREVEIEDTFRSSERTYCLTVSIPGLVNHDFEAGDVFECLVKLRRVIEPAGWRVLCNGARKAAYPSGMCRDMGGGYSLYVMELGRHARREHLVGTFEPCAADLVATVEEQRAFFEAWLKHSKPPWKPPASQ